MHVSYAYMPLGEIWFRAGGFLDSGPLGILPWVAVLTYGANRLKRVPLVLQNVMLYVVRVRIPNSVKMIAQGLLFKSRDQFIIFVHFVKFLQVILQ